MPAEMTQQHNNNTTVIIDRIAALRKRAREAPHQTTEVNVPSRLDLVKQLYKNAQERSSGSAVPHRFVMRSEDGSGRFVAVERKGFQHWQDESETDDANGNRACQRVSNLRSTRPSQVEHLMEVARERDLRAAQARDLDRRSFSRLETVQSAAERSLSRITVVQKFLEDPDQPLAKVTPLKASAKGRAKKKL